MTQSSDTADRTATEAEPIGSDAQTRRWGWKTSLALCAAIVAAGAAAVAAIFATEPAAQRSGATKETAMLVDVVTAEAGTYRPTIVATGTVRPAREVMLRPRVEGRVIDRAPELSPGGLVTQGTPLVRLDPSDYEQTLRQRRSALAEAKAQLRIERGRQEAARSDYRAIDRKLTPDNKALVLHKPQIDAAQAKVASARAALDKARQEFERTTIDAPFAAQVIERQVSVGSQVAAGDALARLVGIETYWIEATVPVSKLRWLTFPNQGSSGATPVRVHNRGAWDESVHRTGRLHRLVGTLDDATRMARVLVAVDDPLARRPEHSGQPRLLLGTYVEARMQGAPLRDVVRLPRDFIRSNDTVWVMADGKLAIRDVTIAVSDRQYAYIRSGIARGERVVTSSLATVEEGAPLRLERESADGGEGNEASARGPGGGRS